MTNSLDSRSIRLGDTFAQQFPKAGKAEYHLAPLGGWPEGSAYTIKISSLLKRKGEPETHHVVVAMKDGELTANPASLEINGGDVVMWCPSGSSTPGFQVCGAGPDGDFNSGAMTGPCVYSHAFGLEGTYRWCDPGGSKLEGEVVVRNPKLDESESARVACRKAIAEGKVILIRSEQAEPAKLEVMTGQTVFWAVEKAGGVAIVDKRLCDAGSDSGAPTTPHQPAKSKHGD